MKTFADFGIDAPATYNAAGDGYTTCPKCSSQRKANRKKCLSANHLLGVWECHHCGWTGSLKQGEERQSVKPKIIRKPAYDTTKRVHGAGEEFFFSRGIPTTLLEAEGITYDDVWMPQEEDFVPCILFPYRKNGEVVNVKYRGVYTKSFRQVTDAEKIWYRQDSIVREAVVICEGEIDALSCVLAGFHSCISVPDGAPSPKVKQYTSKFTFLDQDPDPLEHAEVIILAVDNDEPGQVLREELARRLGRDRCYTVTWPDGCKDANDVLLQHGASALSGILANAQPWPVQDAVSVETLAPEIIRLAEQGMPRGLSTGWPSLDLAFTIAPGQLTIVTGIPSHGKSQLVDALAIHLMQLHGWRFVICSPEHYPTALHGVTLMEKWTGKTVRHNPPSYEAVALTREEMDAALIEMNDALTFIAPADSLTILDLLARTESFVRRRGVQGLIIDPWNEFDHTRERHLTETEYISTTLGLVRRWARKWSVHVFIVAHPTKMQKQENGLYLVPTPYDINGGAAWRNKSDNCLSVWRTLDENDWLVDVHVQKVKWRNLGTMGAKVQLRFDKWTGKYFCLSHNL